MTTTETETKTRTETETTALRRRAERTALEALHRLLLAPETIRDHVPVLDALCRVLFTLDSGPSGYGRAERHR